MDSFTLLIFMWFSVMLSNFVLMKFTDSKAIYGICASVYQNKFWYQCVCLMSGFNLGAIIYSVVEISLNMELLKAKNILSILFVMLGTEISLMLEKNILNILHTCKTKIKSVCLVAWHGMILYGISTEQLTRISVLQEMN